MKKAPGHEAGEAMTEQELYNVLADSLIGLSLEEIMYVMADFLRDIKSGEIDIDLPESEHVALGQALIALEPWSSGETTDPEDDEDNAEIPNEG